jgi:hypothetical protein
LVSELEKKENISLLSGSPPLHSYVLLTHPTISIQDIEFLKGYYQAHYYDEKALLYICNYETDQHNEKSEEELLKLIEDGMVRYSLVHQPI